MKKILPAILITLLLSGCAASVPKSALQLPPESLENRQLQTRVYDSGNERAVLIAANAVLQDLGFNLEDSSSELGVVVGSKVRDATDGGQILMLAVLGALANNPGVMNSADSTQIVRVSLVVRSLDEPGDSSDTDLSPERIGAVKNKVYTAIYDGLKTQFPKDTCDKVAHLMAENTAQTLEGDLDTLLNVKEVSGRTAVRVTFQQSIFNNAGQLNAQRQINDLDIYKEFFEKLSKSLFLEANQV